MMISSFNFTKKDEMNSVSATPIQKVKGETVTVKGAAISEKVDADTGEQIRVGYLSTTTHGMLCTISNTALQGIDLLIDYMTDCAADIPEGSDEQEQEQVKIHAEKANSGREFITLEIL